MPKKGGCPFAWIRARCRAESRHALLKTPTVSESSDRKQRSTSAQLEESAVHFPGVMRQVPLFTGTVAI